MNAKNMEVKIIDNTPAMCEASTQYTPRRTRASEIGRPRLISPFMIYEIGKVAKNTPRRIRIFLRCKLDPHKS